MITHMSGPRRKVQHFRMEPQAKKEADRMAEKLGIPTSRFIELVVLYAARPELMDTWLEMLINFKRARKEMLKHAEKEK